MSSVRPEFHITPSRGWLNDPNGLIQWNGRHHVFHQFDEDSLWFGRMTWGHVSSDDLVHWQRHPVAITPGSGPDRDGVWSGCVVDDDGVATAVYTGIIDRPDGTRIQTVCLATATDPLLIEWVTSPDNPATVEPPHFEADAFRDPYVWRDDDGWAMLLGTGLPDGHGGVLLYRSTDLRNWRYQGVFLGGADLPGAFWTGVVWECPNLVQMDDGTALLLVSVHDPTTQSLHYTVAILGAITGGRFNPTSIQRFDHGHNCYATALEKTDDGRILAFGWAWESLASEGRQAQGWAGCLTHPREVSIENGLVRVTPARELSSASSIVNELGPMTITPEDPVEFLLPDSARIDATFRLNRTTSLRVALRHSPTSGEELVLHYSAARGSLVVDRDQASNRAGVASGMSTVPYSLPTSGIVDITIILDHSIVEIFVGGLSITDRIYPQAPDADVVRIESRCETLSEQNPSLELERLTVSRFVE